MAELPDGRAIVYCEGAFGTLNGKTAHGLVRRTARYRVLSVVDSRHAGRDAGEVLDGRPRGIPVYGSVTEAIRVASCGAEGAETAAGTGGGAGAGGGSATHLVIGLAPEGGRLPRAARADVAEAVRAGLHVDSGLHDFLSEDPELAALARERGVRLRDVRKPPPRETLHFFSDKIREVESVRIAVLGTDSAVGKRTTAWLLVDALAEASFSSVLVGTGQTAWMQGARYGVVLDSLVNDFVTGEIEHAVWSAWSAERPAAIVVEGQGSLLNPAYPGGYEILAAARPQAIVLQHAPRRREYDGFPGYPIHPLPVQIQALELISGSPVVAVAVNHEGMSAEEVPAASAAIREEVGVPAVDPLLQGAGPLVEALRPALGRTSGRAPAAAAGER